jgi:TusE/DsrC/DsvC family sulfur relay protein
LNCLPGGCVNNNVRTGVCCVKQFIFPANSRDFQMTIPERDGDGYLTDMNNWTPEIAHDMAEADGVALDEVKWRQILKARDYFEEHAVVPPIRKFSKYIGEDQKAMFKLWMTGPMKPITKYGGLPKPTGCV